MRWGIVGLALVLAGCAKWDGATREVALAIDGLHAFEAGDVAAIEADQANLAKLYPPPVPFPNPCTREDYAQRRQIWFTGLLGALEREARSATSEEERYARLDPILLGGSFDGSQPNTATCGRSPDRAVLAAVDVGERFAVVKAERDLMVSWAAKLGHPIKEQ